MSRASSQRVSHGPSGEEESGEHLLSICSRRFARATCIFQHVRNCRHLASWCASQRHTSGQTSDRANARESANISARQAEWPAPLPPPRPPRGWSVQALVRARAAHAGESAAGDTRWYAAELPLWSPWPGPPLLPPVSALLGTTKLPLVHGRV